MRWDEIRDAYYDGNYGTIEEYVKSDSMSSEEIQSLLQHCVDERHYKLLNTLFEFPEVYLHDGAIEFLTRDSCKNDAYMKNLYLRLYGHHFDIVASFNLDNSQPFEKGNLFTPQRDADKRKGEFLESSREAYDQGLESGQVPKPGTGWMSSNL